MAFRLGEWDRFDDAVGDVPDTSEFYAMWYACERARRQVYRGDPAPAEGVLDVALAAYRASESAQGLTWAIGGKADAQTAQGRFADAYQTAREGLERSENDITLTAALFAATGLADWELIDELRDVIPRTTNPRLALNRALSDAADCIAAVLDRRWDDAAETFRTAERGLDTVGDAVTLARLRLAVGHLGQDGPAVIADLAATAAEEARRFFDGRGASRYVTEWRSRASRLPSGATPSPTLTAEVAAVRRAR